MTDLTDSHNPTPEEIRGHIEKGRRLRAEATAAGLRWVARRIGAAFRRGEARARPGLAVRLRSSLTAIRSSAEILRDNPDLPSAERARFLQILLIEEGRLEALAEKLASGGRQRAHGG